MSEYAIALPSSAAARRGTCAEFTGIYLPFTGRLVATFPFRDLQTIKCVSKWHHKQSSLRAPKEVANRGFCRYASTGSHAMLYGSFEISRSNISRTLVARAPGVNGLVRQE